MLELCHSSLSTPRDSPQSRDEVLELVLRKNQKSICPQSLLSPQSHNPLKHTGYPQWFPVFIANGESFGKKIFALAIPLSSINPVFIVAQSWVGGIRDQEGGQGVAGEVRKS